MDIVEWEQQWIEARNAAIATARITGFIQVLYLDPSDRLWKVINSGISTHNDPHLRLVMSDIIYSPGVRSRLPDSTRLAHIFIATSRGTMDLHGNKLHVVQEEAP